MRLIFCTVKQIDRLSTEKRRKRKRKCVTFQFPTLDLKTLLFRGGEGVLLYIEIRKRYRGSLIANEIAKKELVAEEKGV